MCDVNGAAEEWSSRRICCRRGDGVSGVEKKTAQVASGSQLANVGRRGRVSGIGWPVVVDEAPVFVGEAPTWTRPQWRRRSVDECARENLIAYRCQDKIHWIRVQAGRWV
jgi:hypothetical protein